MFSMNISSNTNFQKQQPLYGRDKEAEFLTDIFGHVNSGRSEIIMVKGHAGTGKTALVSGVIMPMALEQGYFGSGKCDQFNTGVPYIPIIQAFEEVAAQVLTEKKDMFESWRKKLQRTLGPNAALITEVIPRFKPILGPQPPIEALPPMEAQNRFRLAFQKLIKIFCVKGHPLTLFLDDLHWADPATLELIRYLISDNDQGCLLLAGAYRDNKVTGSHPLTISLDALKTQGLNVREISLDDFNMADTEKFTAAAINNTEAGVKPLAEQLYRKTGGNPLFLVQILKLLKDERILQFEEGENRWNWDMPSLFNLEIPEDVVSLMTVKLQRLPEESGELMKMAACIGSSFDLTTLSIACEKDKDAVITCLQAAIRAGLILPRTDTAGCEVYDFLHDRIHQAAYSMISEDIKKELHLKLGRLLLQSMSGEALDESIALIMDHCNRGLSLISDPSERLTMAENNLKAARKSRNTAAFKSASEFLSAGISFLPQDSWQEHYRLNFDLHLELASCDYLIGNMEEAERLSDLVLQYARTNQELAEIYNLKMVMYAGFGRRVEAVPFGIKALELLGSNLPAKPGKFILFMEIMRIKSLLLGRKPEDLLFLPDMNDPVKKSAMKIMSLLGSVTISIHQNLYILLLLKGTELALRFGNSEMSAVAYAVYAVISGEVLGDYKSAQAFESLSVSLAEKYNSSYAKCITYFVAGALVSHWTRPCKVSIDYLLNSVEYGMQSGELLYTGYSIYLMIEERYLFGSPLTDLDDECRKWYGFVRQMKLDFVLSFIIGMRRFIGTLGGQKDESFHLRMSDELENGILEKIMKSDAETAARHHFFDMQLYYFSGRYEDALAAAEKIDANVLSGFMLSWAYRFYQSLIISAVFPTLSKKSKRKFKGILISNLHRIKKLSDICPENFGHQCLLLSAEYERIKGRDQKAMSFYDQAIDSAHQYGYIQIEAIASESAARFYFALGRDKIAGVYLSDAVSYFKEWGAVAKSEALRNEFTAYMSEPEENERNINIGKYHESVPIGENKNGRSVSADADVLQKVQNIINKSDPERQVEDVLNMLFEYSGADKGYLLLESKEELFIEAEKAGLFDNTFVTETSPLEKNIGLSQTVVRYVARTQETVVLYNSGRNSVFSKDEYLTQHSPGTLICIPLLFHGILAGVLYMESSEAAEAFTPERLETIKQLCAQIAYTDKLQNYFLINKIINADKKPPGFDSLTGREVEVLELIAVGMSNKEIAEKLILSSNTIKMHLSNIYGKLQVQRRVQAVNRAKELGVFKNVETN